MMRKKLHYVFWKFIASLLLLSLFTVNASALPIIELSDSLDSKDISASIEIIENPSGQWVINDLLTLKKNTETPTFQPYSPDQDLNSVHWVRFKLVNQSQTESWYLTINNNYAEKLQLYKVQSATDTPSLIHPLTPQNLPTFPLTLHHTQEATYFLRIEMNKQNSFFSLSIHSPPALLKKSNQRSIFYGLIMGSMLIVSIYNLILSFTLKDFVYASLAIGIASQAFLLLNLNGLYQYLTGSNIYHPLLFSAIYLITITSSMDFLRRIIETKTYVPLMNKVYLGITFFSLIALLVLYWIPRISIVLNYALILLIPSTIVAVTLANLRGKRFATSLLFVAPVYLLTVTPLLLAATGIIKAQTFYLDIMHIGLLLAVILHSLTLTEKTQEINESKKLAQAASEAKSQFLANMSHELRTPMNAVIGLAQLLLRTPLNDVQHGYVSKSLKSSDHMMELIDKVLSFSRIDANKLELTASHFNLKELLNFVMSHIEAMNKENDIQLNLKIDPDIPEFLYADPLALRQILINLTNNAFKFTPKGTISLSVYQLDTTENEVLLRFQVTDTGIGIDPKLHQLLFKPFTQVVNHNARKYTGTGLGLAISHNILQLMDSQLELTSSPDKGSQFFFSVWLGQGKKEIDADVYAETRAETGAKANTDNHPIIKEQPSSETLFSGQVILVVEDDPMNQLVIKKILQSIRLSPIIAESGQSALESLQIIRPQLIFMDLQMPELDGFETTQKIRANPLFAKTPIVALTAHASSEDEHKCLAMGMQGFITKPIDITILNQILTTFLQPEESLSDRPNIPILNSKTAKEVQSNLSLILDELGYDSSRLFMQKTSHYLKNSHQELQDHLANKDWDKAAKCAHRIRGSSNLYGSSRLNQLLLDLDNKKLGSEKEEKVETFTNELNNEFSIIISSMEALLKEE